MVIGLQPDHQAGECVMEKTHVLPRKRTKKTVTNETDACLEGSHTCLPDVVLLAGRRTANDRT